MLHFYGMHTRQIIKIVNAPAFMIKEVPKKKDIKNLKNVIKLKKKTLIINIPKG